MLALNKCHCMDALSGLKLLDNQSVHCGITSPPYYGLRDYGVDGQIGLEASPESYIQRLVTVFHEFHRVLRDDGTLWINIGDSYAGSKKGGAKYPENAKHYKQGTNRGGVGKEATTHVGWSDCKPKDLIGIPWMLAFALRADGWYLRQDIIWAKPNPMPESVIDRCTKSHEYIFLFSKSPHYYYDAESIAEPVALSTVKRLRQDIAYQAGSNRVPEKTNGTMKAVPPRYGGKKYSDTPNAFYRTKSGTVYEYHDRRNKRDVWNVSTKPFKGAHFATFPSDLIAPCVLAGCPENGIICDMFMGSGTTLVTANTLNRNCIGFDVNPDFCNMANKRKEKIMAQQSFFRKIST